LPMKIKVVAIFIVLFIVVSFIMVDSFHNTGLKNPAIMEILILEMN